MYSIKLYITFLIAVCAGCESQEAPKVEIRFILNVDCNLDVSISAEVPKNVDYHIFTEGNGFRILVNEGRAFGEKSASIEIDFDEVNQLQVVRLRSNGVPLYVKPVSPRCVMLNGLVFSGVSKIESIESPDADVEVIVFTKANGERGER